MVLASCASVQVGAAFAAQLFGAVGPAGATALRLATAAALLLGWVRPRVRTWTRAQVLPVVAFGVSLAGMNSAFYAALQRMPLGPAVTVEFLGPLTLAAVLTRRRRDLLWVVLALAGVALLGLGGGEGARPDPVGVGLALVAGALWAAYVLLSARVGAVLPGQAGLAGAMAVAAVLVVPVGVVQAGAALLEPLVLLAGAAVGVLSSLVPYSLELVALRRLPARTFGVLLSLEPAVAALAGWVVLDQGLGGHGVVAVALVVVASAGATGAARRGAPPPAPEV
ncbi:EamA family transporter [Kineococcus glutinatus]|uniref:EamA family transporter n=2 Tax=Kineococcus glutinatus TaxID=1070872 RepID=A0ABP9HHN5_9ACTN